MNTQDVIIAYCGLVCSDCGAFKKGRCQGCHSEKPMTMNCSVKPCCIENSYSTCADCKQYSDVKDCKKLNNFIAKIMKVIFRSKRLENLNSIKNDGLDNFKAQFI